MQLNLIVMLFFLKYALLLTHYKRFFFLKCWKRIKTLLTKMRNICRWIRTNESHPLLSNIPWKRIDLEACRASKRDMPSLGQCHDDPCIDINRPLCAALWLSGRKATGGWLSRLNQHYLQCQCSPKKSPAGVNISIDKDDICKRSDLHIQRLPSLAV